MKMKPVQASCRLPSGHVTLRDRFRQIEGLGTPNLDSDGQACDRLEGDLVRKFARLLVLENMRSEPNFRW